MILKKIIRWLFAYRLTIILFQLLGSIVLIYLTNIWITDQAIQIVASLGLLGIGFLAASQTYLLTEEFRRYITYELLKNLASSQGKTINRVTINKNFKEIVPGSDFRIEFMVEGEQLIRIPLSKKVVPILRMKPALFKGNTDEPNDQFCTWRGSPITCNLKRNGSWDLRGQINFDTCKINPKITVANFAELNLSFHEDNDLLFDLELGHVPLRLISPSEIFQDLIRLEVLKKIPSGFHVLAISRDHDFHTNLIFLSRRFQELKLDKKYSDRVNRLEVAIAHLINEIFATLEKIHPLKKLDLTRYDEPEPYESELNFLPLLDSLFAAINIPQQTETTDKVLIAIFQSREFVMRLGDGLGICLFGFSKIVSSNIYVVFDLCQLKLEYDAGNPCRIEQTLLELLSESSKAFFERYAPQLSITLTSKPKEYILQGKSAIVSSESKEPKFQSETFENLLPLIPAQTSMKSGWFVNSEPVITSRWVNLAVFSDALDKTNTQDILKKAVKDIIDRVTQNYNVDKEHLFILNLCSQNSGIADELSVLWDFQHPLITTMTVEIDRRSKYINLPDQITNINIRKEIIILSPFDSYVSTLKSVIRAVRSRNNIIVCTISLFSTAETWDYVSTSDCFDVIPLFRVNPDYLTGLTPLTEMLDYKRTKPWLFQPR